MVTRNKSKKPQSKEKGRVEIGKLRLNKETVKDLTRGQVKDIKGGCFGPIPKKPAPYSTQCPPPPQIAPPTTVGPVP